MGRIKSTPAPTGDEKETFLFSVLPSITFTLAFFFSFLFLFFFFFSPFHPPLPPFLHLFLHTFPLPCVIQCMSFQRQKQSVLLYQKGRAGSHYCEGNMKGWSGHSMLILDRKEAMAVLYSLSEFVCVCAHACMLVCLCMW